MQRLTVPYVIFEATGSATWVGIATAAQFLPQVATLPLSGFIADHRPRRSVLLATQTTLAALATALWLMWILGIHAPISMFLIIGVIGMVWGINETSSQAIVNDLAPGKDLLSAVTFNSLQYSGARAIGPGVAGLLLALGGPSWALGLYAVSFYGLILALISIRAGRTAAVAVKESGVTRGFFDAVRYAWNQPGITLALALLFVIGFLANPIIGFTIVFAGLVYDVGPLQLGLLNVALGVGAVVAAPIVVKMKSGRVSRTTLVALAIYSPIVVAFGLAHSYWVGLACLVLVGGCHLALTASLNTSIQVIVADRFRGRVFALRILTLIVSFPLGSLALGYLSDRIGPQTTVILSGAALATTWLVALFLRGRFSMSRLNDQHDAR